MKKIILILSLIFLFSCASSRKVENSKIETKTETKTDSVSKIVEKQIIKIDTKVDTEESEFVFTPIDNTKEFIVNNKTYKNVKISHRKKKDNTIIVEAKTIDKKQDIAVKKQIKDRINTVQKKVDKKGLDIFTKIGIIIIAISIIVGAGYLYMKK